MKRLNEIDTGLRERIQLLVCDVDGVLTDGRLTYDSQGECQKEFHVRDGLGIRLLESLGIRVAIISARDSSPLRRRIEDLGVRHVYMGRDDKAEALGSLLEKLDISKLNVAYVGDDILDLPPMRRVALPIAVSDSHSLVREEALAVTKSAGGEGAVREIADALIDARVPLTDAYNEFLERKSADDLLTSA